MKTTMVPVSVCVSCGKPNDAASSAEDVPSPGDVSICLYCGHLSIFANDLSLRPPTDDEMVELAGNPELLWMQRNRP